MSAPNFKDLLAKPVDQIEKPKPVPPGTYNGVIKGFTFGESKDKKTPYVRFALAITGPGDDVDPELLTGVDLSKKQLRRDYYITDDALFMLKDLVTSVGIDSSGRTLDSMIPELVNNPVLIEVIQRSSQDGSEMYNDVKNLKGVA